MLWKDSKSGETQPPLPNSYWVQPGRLLAGEYPGSMSRADAMERVQTLLRAGVNSFIDLTEEGELPEYDRLLPELTEQRVRYRRLPVLDHSVPQSSAYMTQIIDAIADELGAGRCVYVHCRAGIGRTGMAVACHLIRGGRSNQEALEHLQTLWRQSERSRRWPSVPETDEQLAFVLNWREATRAASRVAATQEARAEGALVGLAIGDALGVLASRGGVDAAELTASTAPLPVGVHVATTRALAESLAALGRHDANDQMLRYLQWTRAAVDGAAPTELKRALAAWQWSRKPNAGSHDPKNLHPHSLPRTIAAALLLQTDPQKAMDLAVDVSRTTQQAPVVLDLCRVWCAQLIDALGGVAKPQLGEMRGPAMQLVRQRALKPQVQALLDNRARALSEEDDALSVTQGALRAFATAGSFRDALLVLAAQRASDATLALCGVLGGAHYGVEAIPLEWRRRLADESLLRALGRELLR
jgi:protein-tyrosine phosphatase/ADP-ribosylglycohydrolase